MKNESTIDSTPHLDDIPNLVDELVMFENEINQFDDNLNPNQSNDMKKFNMELKQIIEVHSTDYNKEAKLINAGRMAKAANNVSSKTCIIS